MPLQNGAEEIYPKWIIDALKILKPPEKITVSQWADQNRIIPAGTSNQPGRWKTSKTPYLREIMDSFSNDNIEEIVFLKPTQVGGTEAILNILGYIVAEDPSPTLVVYPSELLAEDISKNRIQPMLKATKDLADKFNEDDSKLLALQFDSMYIPLTGANSAASLSSKPIRFVLLDEVDKYPANAGGGKEADPISLARERTKTFAYNKKVFITSTPTLKTGSIWREWETCTRQLFYYLPCPACGKYQRLVFRQIKFDQIGTITERAATAYYECPYCQAHIHDVDKMQMLHSGRWISPVELETGKPQDGKKTGFALNAIYSPWVTFADVAFNWLTAQSDQGKLQNFVNSWLAEPWEQVSGSADAQAVKDNRGMYTRGVVPEDVKLLVVGVDVQKLGLYYTVDVWIPGKRIRNIDHGYIHTVDFDILWKEVIDRTYYTLSGQEYLVNLALIDSGDQTDLVYDFCYLHYPITVPVKGSNTPIPARYRRSTVQKESSTAKGMQLIDCDGGYYKSMLYSKIRAKDGSFQTYEDVDEDYCDQITSEHLVTEQVRGGATRSVWKPKTSHRPNHFLDCEVYASCAADIMGAFSLLEPEEESQKPADQTESSESKWINIDTDHWI